jgi:glucose-6-phosphate 1-dehydrogenase
MHAMTRRLVVFGATGDLTARKLMPALASLRATGQWPDDLSVLGVAQQDWDTERFRRHMEEALDRHGQDMDEAARRALVSGLEYHPADVTDPKQVAAAVESGAPLTVAYLALPPGLFAPAVHALAQLDLPQESRIVVEKPFGRDLSSAQDLNRRLHEVFPERSVFRIDHFLHKQTVQNVLGLRFANRAFEYLWNRDHVEQVRITWDEAISLEGRAGYYDRAGALKDMIQNHLLQLLCLVGMEAPLALDERGLRDRKVDVLRAVRRLSPDEVERWTVRGRYTSGQAGGQQVPDYVDEPGVTPDRGTETFAQVTLWIDNWRWSGVPFTLRTGKALAAERREIAILFKSVPHLAFAAQDPPSNVLRLGLDPDSVSFGVNLNGAGDPFGLEQVDLRATFRPQAVPAYGRLLLDVLEGDCTLSIRGDEAEESWRIVEPILAGWSEGRVPLGEYAAGTDGPGIF